MLRIELAHVFLLFLLFSLDIFTPPLVMQRWGTHVAKVR